MRPSVPCCQKYSPSLFVLNCAFLLTRAAIPSFVRRHQIVLEDDPNFDPLGMLPRFEFDLGGDAVVITSQISSRKSSNFTPLSGGGLSSGHSQSLLSGFDLSYGNRSSLGIASPFGLPGSSAHKPPPQLDPLEDDMQPLGVLFDFDAQGDLVILEDDQELSPLPAPEEEVPQQYQDEMPQPQPRQPINGEGGSLMLGDEALPDAEAFPPAPVAKASTESSEVAEVAAPIVRRQRAAKRHQFLDDHTEVPKRVVKSWSDEYEANCGAENKKTRPRVMPDQAKANAYHLTYGFGIMNVGQATSIPGVLLPLAEHFSGDGLRAAILGLVDASQQALPQGHRRRSSEAFEEEGEDARRVRPRLEVDGAETGRRAENLGELPVLLGDDLIPEMGRDAQLALTDHHSSLIMPWNRHSSVVPGSSILGHGSAQKPSGPHHFTASPLAGRGSILRDIERFSDAPVLGSDGFGVMGSNNSSLPGTEIPPGTQDGSPWESGRLESASQEFLAYAKQTARDHGVPGDAGLQWIDFVDLADPARHPRAVAAEAFLRVLSLATKDVVKVRQEQEGKKPFGKISIGIYADDETMGSEAGDGVEVAGGSDVAE